MRSLALWTCLLCIAFWTTYSQQTSEAESSSNAAIPSAAEGVALREKEASSRRASPELRPMPEPVGERGGKLIFTHHARERMAERGANDNEVRDTILTGEEVPSYGGKQKFEKTYDCDCNYQGRFYEDKKVEVVAKKKEDGWLIITVIADRK